MDTLTPGERSERMARVRGKDTGPEMRVRRLIHGMGYRYRLHRGGLPGRPDLVFASRRAVVFVHGCFWHQHPDPESRLARMPKSRQEFWLKKLRANRERDERVKAALERDGWRVLTIWECELSDRETERLRKRLQRFLGPASPALSYSRGLAG